MRKIVSPLDGLQSPLGGLTSFSVLSLFAAGETGVWYDPSDLTTMFQDSAGTTPVTAVEQPVGLILDKSKGLALGSELVTNGDFSNGTTGWTLTQLGTSTVSVSGGVLYLEGGATEFPSAAQTVLATNSWYAVTFTKVSGATADQQDLQVRVGDTFINCGLLAAGTYTRYGISGSTTAFTLIKRGVATTAVQIDNVSVKLLAGNHATQATSASRPVLQQDGNSKYYLSFDGVDDGLATSSITPGTNKVQVFAGVRKNTDVSDQIIAELSANLNSNSGSFYLSGSVGSTSIHNMVGKGTFPGAGSVASATGLVAPITSVLTGTVDITGDLVVIRRNGAQAAQSTSDLGTGNLGNYPLYIGRRGDSTVPFNGRIYGLVVRFGANLSDATISQVETWMNTKTGAY